MALRFGAASLRIRSQHVTDSKTDWQQDREVNNLREEDNCLSQIASFLFIARVKTGGVISDSQK